MPCSPAAPALPDLLERTTRETGVPCSGGPDSRVSGDRGRSRTLEPAGPGRPRPRSPPLRVPPLSPRRGRAGGPTVAGLHDNRTSPAGTAPEMPREGPVAPARAPRPPGRPTLRPGALAAAPRATRAYLRHSPPPPPRSRAAPTPPLARAPAPRPARGAAPPAGRPTDGAGPARGGACGGGASCHPRQLLGGAWWGGAGPARAERGFPLTATYLTNEG